MIPQLQPLQLSNPSALSVAIRQESTAPALRSSHRTLAGSLHTTATPNLRTPCLTAPHSQHSKYRPAELTSAPSSTAEIPSSSSVFHRASSPLLRPELQSPQAPHSLQQESTALNPQRPSTLQPPTQKQQLLRPSNFSISPNLRLQQPGSPTSASPTVVAQPRLSTSPYTAWPSGQQLRLPSSHGAFPKLHSRHYRNLRRSSSPPPHFPAANTTQSLVFPNQPPQHLITIELT